MRRFRPRYLIHSHVHLYSDKKNERVAVFEGTTVVNAYDHYVVEPDSQGIGS